MDLKHITTNRCPHCGCTIVTEETVETTKGVNGIEIRVHVNGQRWETSKFACGHKIAWIPNFSREEVKQECKQSDAAKLKKAKRAKATEEAKAFIATLDVDEDWKNDVRLPVDWD
jgi:hypothetical protein